jgi:hypothetical protein
MRGAQTPHAARTAPWSRKRSCPPTARITAPGPVMADRTVDATRDVAGGDAQARMPDRDGERVAREARHLLTGGERAFEDASPAGAEHDA